MFNVETKTHKVETHLLKCLASMLHHCGCNNCFFDFSPGYLSHTLTYCVLNLTYSHQPEPQPPPPKQTIDKPPSPPDMFDLSKSGCSVLLQKQKQEPGVTLGASLTLMLHHQLHWLCHLIFLPFVPFWPSHHPLPPFNHSPWIESCFQRVGLQFPGQQPSLKHQSDRYHFPV